MVKRIPVTKLQPGMRTARLVDSAWLQEPGLYDGAPDVLCRADIERIIADGYCEVCISVEDGMSVDDVVSDALEALPEPLKSQGSSVEESIALARTTYLEALRVASRVVMDVAQGGPVDVNASRAAVRTMLDCVDRDTDGLACVARLTPVDAYLGSHMVNVSALSLAFGRSIGLRESELVPLGLAAFLHDIGMTRLPLDVLSGKTMLSNADEAGLQKHPLFGASLLRSAGGLSKKLRIAVVQHHENHDGSGYPKGLTGQEVHSWARIIHLADVYDGLTRDSRQGRARPPAQALSRMYAMAGAQFEMADVERFVRCMSVYPAGSLVRLSTGEAAVVLRTSRETPTLPLVKVVLDEKGCKLTPRIVDLASDEISVKEPMDIGLSMTDIAGLAFAS